MISYIELNNFKSLTDFKVDFRGNAGKPKKLAFVYGENGSGKTNLISSIFFLSQTLRTLSNYLQLLELTDSNMSEFMEEIDGAETREQVFKDLFTKRFPSLSSLIEENRTIASSENMRIKLGFYLDGVEGSYELLFDGKSVIFEELKYLVNERVGTLYSISKDSIKLSPSLILNSKYKSDLKDEIAKYWGKHTFMSIIYNEDISKNKSFFAKSLSSSFLSFFIFFNDISSSCKDRYGNRRYISTPISVLPNTISGFAGEVEKKELLAMEAFLDSVFTQLYSDIKGVFYKFSKDDRSFSYELYVKKLIGSDIIEVPFEKESTGTQKLLDIVELMMLSLWGGAIAVDEMDSDIHDLLIYELMEIFLEALSESPDSQFIATTHNTYLMEMETELLPKESLYFIRVNAKGEKEALSLDKYKFRTQKNHNIRSKYLKGDYAGIPYTGYFDFNELVDELKDKLEI